MTYYKRPTFALFIYLSHSVSVPVYIPSFPLLWFHFQAGFISHSVCILGKTCLRVNWRLHWLSVAQQVRFIFVLGVFFLEPPWWIVGSGAGPCPPPGCIDLPFSCVQCREHRGLGVDYLHNGSGSIIDPLLLTACGSWFFTASPWHS